MIRRLRRRAWPDGPQYVPPSDWWPVLGVCGILIGVTQHGVGALFGVFGIVALVLYAVRYLRDRETRR